MDIKSKVAKLFGLLLCIVLVLAVSLATLLAVEPAYQRRGQGDNVFESSYLTSMMAQGAYTLTWHAQEQWQNEVLQPSDVFYTGNVAPQNDDGSLPQTLEQYGYDESDEMGDNGAASSSGLAQQKSYFDQTLYIWDTRVSSELSGVKYAVIDGQSGNIYTNDNTVAWSQLLQNGTINEQQAKNDGYRYLLSMKFDESGTPIAQSVYLDDAEAAEVDRDNLLWQIRRSGDSFNTIEYEDYQYTAPATPVTVLYAVPEDIVGAGGISSMIYWQDTMNFASAGFNMAAGISLAVCIGGTLLLSLCRKLQLGRKAAAKVPLEVTIVGFFVVLPIIDGLYELAYSVASGGLSGTLRTLGWVTDAVLATRAAWGLLAGALLLWFSAASFFTLAAANLLFLGPKRYLLERSLTVRFFSWLVYHIRSLWRKATRIDLDVSISKSLWHFLLLNFVVLALCCAMWGFGILVLIIYLVFLFFWLRRRMATLCAQYNVMVEATTRMAQGDLAVKIEGEVGPFNTLRDELNKVRSGFQKAVETEVRSRNMKAELITNVSHDLKTPLTAIITYIDLLRDDSLTEEQRHAYIDTLDRKSQRLKRLIEDLFEVSKATTGNVTMHFAEVDLVALLKQIDFELKDKTTASGIDFRWWLPDHRVPLMLDGQRCNRIFENLIINITKYGLPGTRAYVTLSEDEDTVRVSLKNVSAEELDFDEAQIVERFERGDKARNTEGSGLGLAIAKSFTELQGGKFEVEVDGDLFKAQITWPKTANRPAVPALQEE